MYSIIIEDTCEVSWPLSLLLLPLFPCYYFKHIFPSLPDFFSMLEKNRILIPVGKFTILCI